MTRQNIRKKIFIFSIFCLFAGRTVSGAGTDYVLLEPSLFGQTGTTSKDFITYMHDFFSVIFTAAIVLAVLMIVIGGFQYITSSAIGTKGEGKGRIWAAIQGLIILLISWLALNTINPDLVNWKFKVEPLGTEAQNQTNQ